MNRIPTQIRHDYKTMLAPARPRPRTRRLPWLAAVAVIGAVLIALMSTLLGAASSTGRPVAAEVASAAPAATEQTPSQPVAVFQTAAMPSPVAQDTDVNRHKLTLPAPRSPDGAAVEVDEAAAAVVTVSNSNDIAVALPAPPRPTQVRGAPSDVIRQQLQLPAPGAAVPAQTHDSADEQHTRLELVIRSGDTLDELFADNSLSRADLARLLKLQQVRQHLQLLQPGDRILVSHRDGRITGLQRPINEEQTLIIEHDGDGFVPRIATNPVERRQARAHGVIESSLFRAAQKAGISDNLIMNLAGIFAWDIDFVLDIRAGDRFVVVYEEIWQNGEKLRDGEILAAEFSNQGKPFRAVRFTDDKGDSGYFTPEGLNVKKAFLRAPIAISPRVTSSFNPRRLHPVHKRVRPHRGVDYGAPTGTPIKAAGDGKVIFRGRKGGYGNTVILQHGGNITTLYAHMSRFHKRARVGQRVKQGQIIGYVGATGTVTARHLHYEYRVNGVHRNPRTVKLPKAQPVAHEYRAAFEATAAPLLQQLDIVQRAVRLAESFDQAVD